MENEREIGIELIKIEENLFKLNAPEELNGKIEIGVQCSLKPNEEKDLFNINMGIKYTQNSDILFEYGACFSFKIEGLKELIVRKGNRFKAEYNFIPELVGIAFNTLRGMVFVKTMGTVVSKCTIPLISSDKLISINDKK